MNHAVEILEERRCFIRSIIRKSDDDFATYGSCGLPAGKLLELKLQLDTVNAAIEVLTAGIIR